MFEVISFFTYQTKCLLLRPREVMHGLLTYSVKQLKASLFFLLTGSDTQHENVATAGGLMWFMVPGSRLVFRCEPVLHWSSSKPKPLGVLLIGSNIGESFWTFTALAQVASGLQKQVFFFCYLSFFLCFSHSDTQNPLSNTHQQSCFSVFKSWTRPSILPLLAPSCIIFPKLHLSSGDAHFLWAATYK